MTSLKCILWSYQSILESVPTQSTSDTRRKNSSFGCPQFLLVVLNAFLLDETIQDGLNLSHIENKT